MRIVDTVLAYAAGTCALVGFLLVLQVLRGNLSWGATTAEEMWRRRELAGRSGLHIMGAGAVLCLLRALTVLLWPLVNFCSC